MTGAPSTRRRLDPDAYAHAAVALVSTLALLRSALATVEADLSLAPLRAYQYLLDSLDAARREMTWRRRQVLPRRRSAS